MCRLPCDVSRGRKPFRKPFKNSTHNTQHMTQSHRDRRACACLRRPLTAGSKVRRKPTGLRQRAAACGPRRGLRRGGTLRWRPVARRVARARARRPCNPARTPAPLHHVAFGLGVYLEIQGRIPCGKLHFDYRVQTPWSMPRAHGEAGGEKTMLRPAPFPGPAAGLRPSCMRAAFAAQVAQGS